MQQQLQMFGKRRLQGRKVLEFSIHVAVADVLRRWSTPGWRWTHLPFGEHRNAVTGARLKRMGTQVGWPDFILLSPAILPDLAGTAHFLELKREGSKLNEFQKSFADFCAENGFPHFWCDNFKDAINQLKAWGAVRASVSA
jgi:hypothetical protein